MRPHASVLQVLGCAYVSLPFLIVPLHGSVVSVCACSIIGSGVVQVWFVLFSVLVRSVLVCLRFCFALGIVSFRFVWYRLGIIRLLSPALSCSLCTSIFIFVFLLFLLFLISYTFL